MLDQRLRIATLLLLAFGITAAPTQAQKIGYTNQQLILNNMPRMKKVQKKLQKAYKRQQQRLQKKRRQLQQKIQKYRQQRSLLDDSARAKRKRALRRQQRQLQQSSRKSQQKLRRRERKLMQPLLKNLQSAINVVANRKNIDLVVRSQALLYANRNSDRVVNITQDVAKELGISIEQVPNRPSPSVNPSQTPPPTGGGGGGSQ